MSLLHFFSRESRRLQAAAVEPECAGSTVCDSKCACTGDWCGDIESLLSFGQFLVGY